MSNTSAQNFSKQASTRQPPSPKPAQAPDLPFLLALGFTLSWLIVVATGCAVAIISFFSGAGVLAIALRSGVAILVTGLLGFGINWVLIKGFFRPQPGTGHSVASPSDGDHAISTLETQA
ncbi:MAG: hypothetical protein PHQ40_10555 [Anaerolineaceae bacterium]|nr:hypothetical protein [Anaerolineaceae bacterium]